MSTTPTMADITADVARRHNVTVADLRHPTRGRKALVAPRREAWTLIYATGRFSYPQIGRWFGGRDHSTIHHGRKRYLADLADTERLAA